ncbi:MAG: hypothetical protein WKF57_03915 [Nakamurella sp.]
MTSNRVHAGVPTGGQFAPGARAESDVTLPAGPHADRAARIADLEQVLADGVETWWEGQRDDDRDEVDWHIGEVIGLEDEEEEITARFGADISDRVLRWSAQATHRSRQTYARTMQDPEEWEIAGELTVFDENGDEIGSWDMSHEDYPRIPAGWLTEQLT